MIWKHTRLFLSFGTRNIPYKITITFTNTSLIEEIHVVPRYLCIDMNEISLAAQSKGEFLAYHTTT